MKRKVISWCLLSGIIIAAVAFALFVSRMPSDKTPPVRDPIASTQSLPARLNSEKTQPKSTTTTQPAAAPPTIQTPETTEARERRILAAIHELLASLDPVPPEDDAALARFMLALFSGNIGLTPADLPNVISAFTAELAALGPEAKGMDRPIAEAVFVVRALLGIVFQNLENPQFAAFIGPDLAKNLVAGVLELFAELPEDARLYLAEAMLEDEMLRGTDPKQLLQSLLAMQPIPKSVDILLGAYAKDPVGSEFIAELEPDTLPAKPNDAKLHAVILTEKLRKIGKPEFAKQLFEESSSEEEKRGILQALTNIGEPDIVVDLARANAEGTVKGPRLSEIDFRLSLWDLYEEEKLTPQDIARYLLSEPESQHPMLLSALKDRNLWVTRWMLGIEDDRIPSDFPAATFSDLSRSRAAHALANRTSEEELSRADVEGIVRTLRTQDTDALTMALYAWMAVGTRHGATYGDIALRELRIYADHPRVPEWMQKKLRAAIEELER